MKDTKASLEQYYALFVTYLKPHWPLALLLAVLLFGNIGLRLVNPQIMRQFIDTAIAAATDIAAADETVLINAALLFLGVAVVQQIVSVLVIYVGKDVGWKATNALRSDLARHCLGLDMSFHNAHRPGELIERIDGDVNQLSNFFSQFVVQIVGNALLLVGVLVMLFLTDWRAGGALAVFVSISLPIMVGLQGFGAGMWEEERQARADLFGFLEERLAGTEDIRSSGAKAYVMRRFYELLRTAYQRVVKAGAVGAGITYNTANVLFGVGMAASLAVGAWLYLQGEITVGTVYLIFNYGNLLAMPIEIIARQMQDLQRAGAGVSRVRELLSVKPSITSTFSELTLPEGALAVAFRSVTFGYAPETRQIDLSDGDTDTPGDESLATDVVLEKEMVLQDVTFCLAPGKVLGLLGRTGSGKTTLSRLLFRLYDPDYGTVCLGGDDPIDLRALPLDEVRRRVGVVTQDIQLFQATVRDNLTLFDDTIPDERLLDVIEDLGMHSWLDSLANGLDTELASGGGSLSAGEAQLFALMRIFMQDPGLIILDEASSRLDPVTEKLIEHALDKLIQGRTAIVIAHRLGTVGRTDEIMILEGGKIVEHGGRSQLSRDPSSHFYRLLQTGLEEMLV
ncbi:MAG: ABC transporter ATP-binding protein [Anaerolineae bacterium]|nr:ABC transporter ATP-binding protein [Anaerolineae bacterium]